MFIFLLMNNQMIQHHLLKRLSFSYRITFGDCISQLCVTTMKYLRQLTYKEKRFTYLSVLEVQSSRSDRPIGAVSDEVGRWWHIMVAAYTGAK